MKTFWLGILGAIALALSSHAAAFQFNSVTTYSQETPATFTFAVGLVTRVQANLPMAVDLANVNEATSFRINASAMWNGDDFTVLLGQDPGYKPGATKATINTPSGNVQLTWTATNVSFSGVLIDNHSAPNIFLGPVATPIPLGFPGAFTTNTTLSVHFQYSDFTHPATLTGTNKIVTYATPGFVLPGLPPTITYVDVNTGKFHVTADLVPPTIKFNSPKQNTVITGSDVNVSLTVSDNVLLGTGPLWLGAGSTLAYSVNGGAFYSDANTFPGMVSTTHTLNLNGSLNPGTNVLTFVAADSSGNLGTNTLVLFFSQKSPITLITNGVGGITGVTNGQMLEIGRNYVVTGKPGPGQILTAWQDENGTVLSRSNSLTFMMHDGMSLTASFADNPFPSVQGTYFGYFMRHGVSPDVSQFGSFKMTVTASGSFSGTLKSAVEMNTFSGQFLYTSNGVQDARCLALGKTTNLLILSISTDPASNEFATVNGALIFGANGGVQSVRPKALAVYADVEAGRATNATVLQGGAGTYHYSVASATNGPNFPEGYGFGTLTVLADGTVNGSVTLADGDAPMTTFSTHLVYTGYAPVFVPLYSKGGGFLMTPNLGAVSNDGTGTISDKATWVKAPGKKFYPNGFATGNDVFVARYISLPSGLSSGNFSALLGSDVAVSTSVTIASNGTFTDTGSSANVQGTITPTGSITGTFLDNGISRSYKALVVPTSATTFDAAGFFVRSNQTGLIGINAP